MISTDKKDILNEELKTLDSKIRAAQACFYIFDVVNFFLFFMFFFSRTIGNLQNPAQMAASFGGDNAFGAWFATAICIASALALSTATHLLYSSRAILPEKTWAIRVGIFSLFLAGIVFESITISAGNDNKVSNTYNSNLDAKAIRESTAAPVSIDYKDNSKRIAELKGAASLLQAKCDNYHMTNCNNARSLLEKAKSYQDADNAKAAAASQLARDMAVVKYKRQDEIKESSFATYDKAIAKALGVSIYVGAAILSILAVLLTQFAHFGCSEVSRLLTIEKKRLRAVDLSNVNNSVDNFIEQGKKTAQTAAVAGTIAVGSLYGTPATAAPVFTDVAGYAYPQTQQKTQGEQTHETQNTAENTAPKTLQHTQESAPKLSTAGENEVVQNLGNAKKVEFNFMAFLADFEGRILSGELDTTAKATREYAREYVDAVFKGDGRTCSNPHADRLAKMCLRNIARRKEGDLIDVCKATGRPAGNLGKLRAYMLVNDFNEKMKKG